jgi:hypothetical protein
MIIASAALACFAVYVSWEIAHQVHAIATVWTP